MTDRNFIESFVGPIKTAMREADRLDGKNDGLINYNLLVQAMKQETGVFKQMDEVTERIVLGMLGKPNDKGLVSRVPEEEIFTFKPDSTPNPKIFEAAKAILGK